VQPLLFEGKLNEVIAKNKLMHKRKIILNKTMLNPDLATPSVGTMRTNQTPTVVDHSSSIRQLFFGNDRER
jgi:hypothetical protein